MAREEAAQLKFVERQTELLTPDIVALSALTDAGRRELKDTLGKLEPTTGEVAISFRKEQEARLANYLETVYLPGNEERLPLVRLIATFDQLNQGAELKREWMQKRISRAAQDQTLESLGLIKDFRPIWRSEDMPDWIRETYERTVQECKVPAVKAWNAQIDNLLSSVEKVMQETGAEYLAWVTPYILKFERPMLMARKSWEKETWMEEDTITARRVFEAAQSFKGDIMAKIGYAGTASDTMLRLMCGEIPDIRGKTEYEGCFIPFVEGEPEIQMQFESVRDAKTWSEQFRENRIDASVSGKLLKIPVPLEEKTAYESAAKVVSRVLPILGTSEKYSVSFRSFREPNVVELDLSTTAEFYNRQLRDDSSSCRGH